MYYGYITRRAWHVAKKHKYLWIFGSVLSIPLLILIIFLHEEILSDFSYIPKTNLQGISIILLKYLSNLKDIITNNRVLKGNRFLEDIIFLIVLPILLAAEGGIITCVKNIKEGKENSLKYGINVGRQYFYKIARIDSLKFLTCIPFLTFLFIYPFFTYFRHNIESYDLPFLLVPVIITSIITILYFSFYFSKFLFMFVLFLYITISYIIFRFTSNIPIYDKLVLILSINVIFSIIILFFTVYITRFIVLKDIKIIELIKSSFRLGYANFKHTFVVALILLTLGILANIILLILGIFLINTFPTIFTLIFMVILYAFINGFRITLSSSVWTLTFLHLTEGSLEKSVIYKNDGIK